MRRLAAAGIIHTLGIALAALESLSRYLIRTVLCQLLSPGSRFLRIPYPQCRITTGIPTSESLSTLKTTTIPRRNDPFLHPIVIRKPLPTTLPRDQTTQALILILPTAVCKAATTTTILKAARLHLTENQLATIVLDVHHLTKATAATTAIKATTPTGVAEEDIWVAAQAQWNTLVCLHLHHGHNRIRMEEMAATETGTIRPVDLQARLQHHNTMEATLMSTTLTTDSPTRDTVAPILVW